MPNGGFGAGYNVQFATDAANGIIVGVSVTNSSSDSKQAPPMVEQIEKRTGRRPEAYLTDAAYADKKSVETLAEMNVTLYGAVPVRNGKDPFKPEMKDSAAVSAWRKRLGTDEAKEICKARAPTAERVNADVRTYRTLDRILVRGAGKVLCVALWNALGLNLMWDGNWTGNWGRRGDSRNSRSSAAATPCVAAMWCSHVDCSAQPVSCPYAAWTTIGCASGAAPCLESRHRTL